MTLVRMTVKGLMLDPISNSPIVVLRDDEDSTLLPIWVGVFEANAIALKLENYETPRPMTHDLLKGILGALSVDVVRVVVNELRDSTFFARIVLSVEGRETEVDSRPSDAIALALRVDAPIFVDQSVLDQAQTISPDDTQDEKLRKWFEQLNPEEMGKYKM
ncbi:MAG: bifunctional nuclease family protein [Thermoanaerobaculia bacterium]